MLLLQALTADPSIEDVGVIRSTIDALDAYQPQNQYNVFDPDASQGGSPRMPPIGATPIVSEGKRKLGKSRMVSYRGCVCSAGLACMYVFANSEGEGSKHATAMPMPLLEKVVSQTTKYCCVGIEFVCLAYLLSISTTTTKQAFSESDDIPFFDSTVDLLAEQRWTKGLNRVRATKRYLAIFIIAILTALVAVSTTRCARNFLFVTCNST